MMTRYIADAEKDVGMKELSLKETLKILEDMKVDIPVPKAAVTQHKRNCALDMAIEALKCSEAPNSSENHSAGVSKMMDGDTIYRQAAIGAMRTRYDTELKEFDNGDEYINYDQAVNELKRIPSVSCAEESCNSENYFPDSTKMASGDLISRGTEQLTDTEQRIFLAAMGREEKVCKQVDEECRDCREPYEDSLVRICHEIVRKVKGALWTI